MARWGNGLALLEYDFITMGRCILLQLRQTLRNLQRSQAGRPFHAVNQLESNKIL